jgi:hypothetical protein
MEAVRRAIQSLGDEAAPADICRYVKENHGIEMTPKFASSYKSTILRKEGRRQPRSRRIIEEESEDTYGYAGMYEEAREETAGASLSLRDIKTLKDLADRVGPHQLRELLDVLYPNS